MVKLDTFDAYVYKNTYKEKYRPEIKYFLLKIGFNNSSFFPEHWLALVLNAK